MTRPLLLRGGLVVTPGSTEPADVLIADGRVAAVTAAAPRGPAVTGPGPSGAPHLAHVREVRLDGRLVTPAFVDAHVHLAATGLAARGVDLSGAASVEEALGLLAGSPPTEDGSVLLGHGWDETTWREARPPTRAELDRAVGDRPAYVSRVDVHSAVVSTALLRLLDGNRFGNKVGNESGERGAGGGTKRLPTTSELSRLAGWSDQGPLTRDAHHAVRGAYHALLARPQRRAALGAALREAARVGVGTVHELGAPHLSDPEDALLVQDERQAAAVAGRALPRVVPYWGERGDLTLNRRHGWGAAGDICVDGAVGSRTAALRQPYADAATLGHLYLTADEVARHVVACTEEGLQAGFHAIGDRAVRTVVEGLLLAARDVGADMLRAARHRLEHVEMITARDVELLAELGVVASVQPLFDGWWGGPGGLYEQRLGTRSCGMNPFATMKAAGVTLAFGSDSPVTPVAPWQAVRAAVRHSDPGQSLSVDAALAAHTTGGWAAARGDGGTLVVGAPADLAVWDVTDLDRAVDPSADLPRCLLTVVGGVPAHGSPEDLEARAS